MSESLPFLSVYLGRIVIIDQFCCSEDILVFLTGQEEIESVVKSIRDISRDLPSGLYPV